jgi:hypothetical protein
MFRCSNGRTGPELTLEMMQCRTLEEQARLVLTPCTMHESQCTVHKYKRKLVSDCTGARVHSRALHVPEVMLGGWPCPRPGQDVAPHGYAERAAGANAVDSQPGPDAQHEADAQQLRHREHAMWEACAGDECSTAQLGQRHAATWLETREYNASCSRLPWGPLH